MPKQAAFKQLKVIFCVVQNVHTLLNASLEKSTIDYIWKVSTLTLRSALCL